MSLLINGMDMPKNCRQCDFTHCTRFGQKLCTFLREATSIKKKLPDCPLTEIPTPHGRLIDADRLYDLIEDKYKYATGNERALYRYFLDIICDSNTIIEAED